MIDIDKIEATAKASRDAAAPYHAPYLFASADIVLELIGLIRKQEAALSGAQASYGALAMELATLKATDCRKYCQAEADAAAAPAPATPAASVDTLEFHKLTDDWRKAPLTSKAICDAWEAITIYIDVHTTRAVAAAERDKDGNHVDDLRAWLDEAREQYEKQDAAFHATALKLKLAEAALAAAPQQHAQTLVEGRTPDGRTIDLPVFGNGSKDGKNLLIVALPETQQHAQAALSDESWTIVEQKAISPLLDLFPNESSQGLISLGTAWKHGVEYGKSLASVALADSEIAELRAALAVKQDPVIVARIKRYRDAFGCTLKEAKEVCDAGGDISPDGNNFIMPSAQQGAGELPKLRDITQLVHDAGVMAPNESHYSVAITALAQRAASVPADKQTDLSKRLRDLVGAEPGAKQLVILPKTLLSAAEEIERYYTGMMNWKATAEAKDVASVPAEAVQPVARRKVPHAFSCKNAVPNSYHATCAEFCGNEQTCASSEFNRERVRAATAVIEADERNQSRPWLIENGYIDAPVPAASVQGGTWRDALRRSGANTDYHGLVAFTGKQLESFVHMLAATVPQDIGRDAALKVAVLRDSLQDARDAFARILSNVETGTVHRICTKQMQSIHADLAKALIATPPANVAQAAPAVLSKLEAALKSARTSHGSYGPNYDGNKLAESIRAILAAPQTTEKP